MLVDTYGRRITYLRLSVTDRCDLRCRYCMAERMQFEPKPALLTIEEMEAVAAAFIARGVSKIRISGGEPFVRRNIMYLFERLSRYLENGKLGELTATTNATLLSRYAARLKALGVSRLNVSLDTLDPVKFAEITRRDALHEVMEGIQTALAAGIKLKINTVALKNGNLDEIPAMIEWAHGLGMDMTLIEVMPLGDVGADRIDQYEPLSSIRENLGRQWTLTPTEDRTGGPARYVQVEETGGRLGFITPLTNNFCDGCNRVRVTCTGQLYMCLGQQDRADLRHVLRTQGARALGAALDEAMMRKPYGHDFSIDRRGAKPAAPRFMSATGG